MQDFLPSFLRPPSPRRNYHRAFAPVKARPTTISPLAELPGKQQTQPTTPPPSDELAGKYPRPSSPPTEALQSHNLKLKSDVSKKLAKKHEFNHYKKSVFPPFKKVANMPTSTSHSPTTTETTTTATTTTTTSTSPPKLTTANKTESGGEGGEASHVLPSYADPPPLYPRPSSPPPDFLPRIDLDSQNGDGWSPLEGRMDSKPLAPPLTFYEVPGPSATRITKSSPSSSYGAPKSKPSSSYGPPKVATPSYGSPKAAPLPSYGPPEPVPSYSPPKAAIPSYTPPKKASVPSYSPPKPASPSYAPPKASLPSYGPPVASGPTYGGGGRMPYAFDYAVASSYGASFAAREEESGKGTVGQFQLVLNHLKFF